MKTRKQEPSSRSSDTGNASTTSLARILSAAGLAFVACGASSAAAATCESLATLALPNTTIALAQSVPAGSFTAPNGQVFQNMPAFCRVAAAAHPTSDSNIQFEVWMPSTGWNGKFNGVGNGGLAGTISYSAMAPVLQLGYATASTDTGHTNAGGIGSFALGHPEKIIDFGYRAHHELAQKSKAIIAAFYGQGAKRAYYTGCSQGGQEGLMEVQRFPDDYDGAVVGDPDNFFTHHEIGAHLWITLTMFGSDPNGVIPISKDALIGNAVNAACDAKDGLSDGILNDPRRCHFDPSVLLCQPGQDPSTCLTAAQVDAVKKVWSGVDREIHPGFYPGFERGAEATNWPGFISPSAPLTNIHSVLGLPFFKYFVFDDPNWDFHTFNFKTDVPLVLNKLVAGQTMSSIFNSTNPDLEPFKRHGGKLIHYHGFSDDDVPPVNSINYYQSVVAVEAEEHGPRRALEETQDFYRLFMIPGMSHCSGGPGTDHFDALTALDNWVEHGVAPDKIIASHVTNGVVTMTRPLCPYPQEARYKGFGDPNDAASFVCALGEHGRDISGLDNDRDHHRFN